MATKEQAHMAEAFEYYYSLGQDRGYRKVAQQFNVSLTTVSKWAKAFNWQSRLEERDHKVAKELERKTTTTIVNQKANYRKILHTMIGNMVKEMQLVDEKGKPCGVFPKIETMADLEKVVKLDLLLMGESTDKIETAETPQRPVVEQAIDDWLRSDPNARTTIRDLYRSRISSGS